MCHPSTHQAFRPSVAGVLDGAMAHSARAPSGLQHAETQPSPLCRLGLGAQAHAASWLACLFPGQAQWKSWGETCCDWLQHTRLVRQWAVAVVEAPNMAQMLLALVQLLLLLALVQLLLPMLSIQLLLLMHRAQGLLQLALEWPQQGLWQAALECAQEVA